MAQNRKAATSRRVAKSSLNRSTAKKLYTNWSSPENIDKLSTAVNGWLRNDKCLAYHETKPDKKLSLRAYASKVGIPEGTLRPYLNEDAAKRKRIGAKPGRPSIVEKVVEAELRTHENECTTAQLKAMLSNRQQELSPKQVRNYMRTFNRHTKSSFYLVPLKRGSSDNLRRASVRCKKIITPLNVFTVSTELATEELKRQFSLKKLSTSFTDEKRKLYRLKGNQIIHIYKNVRDHIETTTTHFLNLEGYVLCNDVLISTTSCDKDGQIVPALRQQFHRDFPKGSRKFFVIVPSSPGQCIYIRQGKVEKRVLLDLDSAFVGDASLIHCGSEVPGDRFHFFLSPKEEEATLSQEEIWFEEDKDFPGLKSFW